MPPGEWVAFLLGQVKQKKYRGPFCDSSSPQSSPQKGEEAIHRPSQDYNLEPSPLWRRGQG